MRKLLSILLAFVMLLSLAPMTLASGEVEEPVGTVEEPAIEETEAEPAEAEEPPAEEVPALDGAYAGTCGKNLLWRYEDGVLRITGTGSMYDFEWFNGYEGSRPPWHEVSSDIVSVVLEPGLTTLGAHVLSGCSNLKSVTIPDGVTSISRCQVRTNSSLFD